MFSVRRKDPLNSVIRQNLSGSSESRSLIRYIGLIFCLSWISLLPACSASTTSNTPTGVEAELYTLSGSPVALSSLQGRPLLITFWASWCPVCQHTLRTMNEIYPKVSPYGLEFVAIAIDDELPAVTAAARSLQLRFPLLFDRHGSAKSAFGVEAIPETHLLSRSGTAVEFLDPETKQQTLRASGPRSWSSGAALTSLAEIINRHGR